MIRGLLFMVSVLSLALATDVNLIVDNRCRSSIWCGAAKNDGTWTPSVQVYPGGTYTSPKPALADGVGVVLKCGTEALLSSPYQLEVDLSAEGWTWVDLSALNGHPFLEYHRRAEVVGADCAVDCPPNETADEWPTQLTCKAVGDVVMTLC